MLTLQRSNERASDVYTTEVITKILKEEGQDLFDSRSASLGHTLQGGTPSPLDRARATRLAVPEAQRRRRHARHAALAADEQVRRLKHLEPRGA